MDIVKSSIEKPVTVLVGVILVLLFGSIGLMSMPYQLSPTVIEPEITVTTIWSGATPYEIERDVIEEQEKVLKGIPGLLEMESEAFNSRGEISLKFKIGTDVDNALLRVSNKLNEVPRYPDNVERPVINATGASTSPIIYMIMKTMEDNPKSINTYRTFFENEIRQYLERVEGVADLFVFGGTEKEMHVVVKPERLAAFGLTIQDLIDVLRTDNVNVSAGSMGVGRRDYRIRTVGEFESAEDIEGIVVQSTGEKRITVGDLAAVHFGYAKKNDAMMHNAKVGIVVGVRPEPGANVLELTNRVEKVVQWLNRDKLEPAGIQFDWAYDQRPYINGAIDLVKQNIFIGGVLAILVLLVYLRSASSTLVVATAIPISVVGTFVFMNALGRNLNVVSLAGISFAVGMLVDNAIVVLENIDRHRKMGKSSFHAAYDGAREVWGAVLASTLTTVAVFLPVVFIEEEAGQLFKDIAIAVTSAVALSLTVSVSVIPMLSRQFYRLAGKRERAARGPRSRKRKVLAAVFLLLVGAAVFALFPKLGSLASAIPTPGAILQFLAAHWLKALVLAAAAGLAMAAFVHAVKIATSVARLIVWLVSLAVANWATRLVTIASLTTLAIASAYFLLPKMEYLPQGNRNLILSILIPPPGLSYEERMAIGEYIFETNEPYFFQDRDGFPGIEDMFYVGSERIMLYGATSVREQRAGELIPLFMRTIYSIPGMFGISTQAGIFQTELGKGRTIDIDISAGDLNRVVSTAGAMFGMLRQEIPDAQVRPIPSLELLYPEILIEPHRDRLRALRMSAQELGIAVDVLMDGRDVGDYKEPGEKKIDLVLKASEDEITTPEALYDCLVATPGGRVVPLYSLAHLERTTGITQIRHLERQRTVTLQVTPPERMPLQEAMELVDNKILPAMRGRNLLEGMSVRMSGAADKLTQTRKAMQWNFLLALVITYLLMSALFGNFIYPFIVMFTVPLAAAGGFIGLKLVNILITPQPLDILTMLGFIILIGVVVNNAILVVYQALNNVREYGMEHKEAVLDSVRTRIRPIYMSASTSVFGMLPLVVAPGPGSELYRGLGSVVLGGLAFSTIFTIFVIPALLMFFIPMESPARPEGEVAPLKGIEPLRQEGPVREDYRGKTARIG